MIPKDPVILLSFVNMKLRDEFSNLDDLCASLDLDQSELIKTLEMLDYHYDSAYHQFI